jgi:cell division protein FtsL
MSGRICFVLLLLLVASSLSLVRAQYQARRLFIDLEQAKSNARQLDGELSQLQLDQSMLGKHSRLSELAQRELAMVALEQGQARYLVVGEQSKSGLENKLNAKLNLKGVLK